MFFIFKYDYGIIGGDIRQTLLLQELEKEYACISYDIKKIDKKIFLSDRDEKEIQSQTIEEMVYQSENLLFPIPFLREGKLNLSKENKINLQDLEEMLYPGQKIYGGKIPLEFRERIEKKGMTCFDYMEEESIATYNSIATAEGVIAEILQSFPYNLHGAAVLVLGYGRCAKTLVNKLQAMKAKVTVYARRKEAGMEAYTQGADCIGKEELLKEIEKFPVIINTIPQRIFKKNELEIFPLPIYLYEIASSPYCADPKEAKEVGINFYVCSGLPGKYSPISSAMILKKYLLEKRKEEKKNEIK